MKANKFYFEVIDNYDDEFDYDYQEGKIEYGDGNIKKCAPSLDDYDGNETQEY